MTRSGLIFGVVAAVAIVAAAVYGTAKSSSTVVLGLNCVGAVSSPYYCQGGNNNSLRANMNAGNNAIAAGFSQPGDGGGGDFYDFGNASTSAAAGTKCLIILSSSGLTGTGSVGSPIIYPLSSGLPGSSYTYLTVGEAVSGSGSNIQIPKGAEIASITPPVGVNPGFLTLTLPLTGTATGLQSISIAISADNGGTLIVDSESTTGDGPGPQCWQKTNYHGDPHEFGAFGDGVTDDTMPMEDWFGAYGNVNPNLAPATTHA